eukprot:1682739-Amphidinium_carterae.5
MVSALSSRFVPDSPVQIRSPVVPAQPFHEMRGHLRVSPWHCVHRVVGSSNTDRVDLGIHIQWWLNWHNIAREAKGGEGVNDITGQLAFRQVQYHERGLLGGSQSMWQCGVEHDRSARAQLIPGNADVRLLVLNNPYG